MGSEIGLTWEAGGVSIISKQKSCGTVIKRTIQRTSRFKGHPVPRAVSKEEKR